MTCPLTPETNGLIGAERLAMMKPSARIIVLSRGSIVMEKPLLAALENGSIQGAAFDAFTSANLGGEYGEEMVGDYPRDCPLWEHPQVIITPHTSASARRPCLLSLTGRDVSDGLCAGAPSVPEHRGVIFRDNLRDFLAGRPFRRVCDKVRQY